MRTKMSVANNELKNKCYRILDLKQGSPEWLLFRKGKMGASMAPAIMGISPYTTRLQLWEDIVFDKKRSQSPAMARGSSLEEHVRKWVNEEFHTNFRPTVVQSIAHPDFIASFDGYYEDGQGNPHILEIKVPNKQDHDVALSGYVPAHYYPQLQHQMDIIGAEECMYVSFDGEDEAIVICKRDEEYCKKLFIQELSFLVSVINYIPPLPEDRDWVEINDPTLITKSFRYKELTNLIDELESERDELRNFLTTEMEYPRSMVGDLKIQKISRKGTLDYERIIEEYEINNLDRYRKKPTETYRITFS